MLLAISTCGNSPNCLRALERARSLGIHTVAYTGNDGGKMEALADINVIVPSNVTMNIQESHLALEHIFCMLVERCYFGPGLRRLAPERTEYASQSAMALHLPSSNHPAQPRVPSLRMRMKNLRGAPAEVSDGFAARTRQHYWR